MTRFIARVEGETQQNAALTKHNMMHHKFSEITTHSPPAEVGFEEHHILQELKHYLPSQTPLKDFIHHNSLHAFQTMEFYDAIFKASKIFGYKVTFNLAEYRGLYQIGRIRVDILDQVIAERKGAGERAAWKQGRKPEASPNF